MTRERRATGLGGGRGGINTPYICAHFVRADDSERFTPFWSLANLWIGQAFIRSPFRLVVGSTSIVEPVHAHFRERSVHRASAGPFRLLLLSRSARRPPAVTKHSACASVGVSQFQATQVSQCNLMPLAHRQLSLLAHLATVIKANENAGGAATLPHTPTDPGAP